MAKAEAHPTDNTDSDGVFSTPCFANVHFIVEASSVVIETIQNFYQKPQKSKKEGR
jgi:hypothetical protein